MVIANICAHGICVSLYMNIWKRVLFFLFILLHIFENGEPLRRTSVDWAMKLYRRIVKCKNLWIRTLRRPPLWIVILMRVNEIEINGKKSLTFIFNIKYTYFFMYHVYDHWSGCIVYAELPSKWVRNKKIPYVQTRTHHSHTHTHLYSYNIKTSSNWTTQHDSQTIIAHL